MYEEPITGRVQEIVVVPHGPHVVIRATTPGDDNSPWLSTHLNQEEGGTILWNGQKVKSTVHLVRLFMQTEYPVFVVLHPRIDRYGACTDAEFTSVKEVTP